MSCKKEFSLQLTHLFIKALFLIFIFNSCSKEEIYHPENPPNLPNQNPTKFDDSYFFSQRTKQDFSLNLELENVKYVLTMEKHIRNLILNTLFASYFYPQLRGLTGTPLADTRAGCPCSSLSPDESTLTLEYNDCSTLSGANYNGTITVDINGVLDVAGTEVTITLSDGFMVDDGMLDGSLSMTYEDGTDRYNIDDLCLSNTTNGIDITKVGITPGGFGGQIEVVQVNTNTDPTGLIDDNFYYHAADLQVTCPDPGTGELPEVLNVFLNHPILFNILCGVPQDGEVALTRASDGSNFGTIDFAHPNVAGGGECNNMVAVYLASNLAGTAEIIIIE